jgi:hypothetical protein
MGATVKEVVEALGAWNPCAANALAQQLGGYDVDKAIEENRQVMELARVAQQQAWDAFHSQLALEESAHRREMAARNVLYELRTKNDEESSAVQHALCEYRDAVNLALRECEKTQLCRKSVRLSLEEYARATTAYYTAVDIAGAGH